MSRFIASGVNNELLEHRALAVQIETPERALTTRPARKAVKRASARRTVNAQRPLSTHKQAKLAELARDVAHAHVDFGTLLAATAARGLQIGGMALEAKRIAGHGHFGAWKESLRDQHGVSDRSVERYMYLAKHRRQLLASLQVEPTDAEPRQQQDAETLLGSLRIQEALELLKASTATPERRPTTAAPTAPLSAPARFVPGQVMEIARELFGHIDLIVTEAAGDFSERLEAPALTPQDAASSPAPWRGQILVHARREHLAELVARLTREYSAGHLEAALLLAPAITDDPALAELQAYPRAFFRQRLRLFDGHAGMTVADAPYLLILVADEDRLADFALAAGGHADIYVAYHF